MGSHWNNKELMSCRMRWTDAHITTHPTTCCRRVNHEAAGTQKPRGLSWAPGTFQLNLRDDVSGDVRAWSLVWVPGWALSRMIVPTAAPLMEWTSQVSCAERWSNRTNCKPAAVVLSACIFLQKGANLCRAGRIIISAFPYLFRTVKERPWQGPGFNHFWLTQKLLKEKALFVNCGRVPRH